MNKPISLIIEDARQAIIHAVNNTDLPPVLLESIIKDIYNEIRQLKLEQYKSDKAEYERSLQLEQVEKNKKFEQIEKVQQTDKVEEVECDVEPVI